jgi:hypothetical protein
MPDEIASGFFPNSGENRIGFKAHSAFRRMVVKQRVFFGQKIIAVIVEQKILV